jgi:hypothetical protein
MTRPCRHLEADAIPLENEVGIALQDAFPGDRTTHRL